MKTLKELSSKIDFNFKHGAIKSWDKLDDWQKNANGYRITLKHNGKKMSLDFWQGQGIKENPTVESVLECLLSDASCAEDSFENFCANCGYDDDSRKAHSIYKQIEKQTIRLKNLLGNDYDAFLYAERD